MEAGPSRELKARPGSTTNERREKKRRWGFGVVGCGGLPEGVSGHVFDWGQIEQFPVMWVFDKFIEILEHFRLLYFCLGPNDHPTQRPRWVYFFVTDS